jgi:hypothetical protein
MSPRIVTYALAEIESVPEEVVAALNVACNRRRTKYRVRGLFQLDDVVYFLLLPRERLEKPETYVLVPLTDVSSGGFPAGLMERWAAGFDAVGLVRVAAGHLALFARVESPRP